MYAKISNGAVDQYPYTVGNLRRDNPNTSFPKRPSDEMLMEWGLHSVVVEEMPSINFRTQDVASSDIPTLSGGSWSIGWTVTSKTSEETQDWDDSIASSNRDTRNQLLSDSDWTQIPDSALTDEAKALWVTYRTALRDLTAHANWPNLADDDWPTKP